MTGLMEMQFDRYREVAGINRHSRYQDPTMTGKDEVTKLVETLADGDEDHRISAAQRLAIHRDQAAATALAECLKVKNRELRVAAAVALAACGTRKSIEPLLDALEDRDALVVQAAVMALENLTGHVEPIDAYADRLARQSQMASWRRWFAETSWEAIEQNLIGLLANEDRDVVRRAAVALSHVGSSASHGALRQYLIAQREINPLPEWRKAAIAATPRDSIRLPPSTHGPSRRLSEQLGSSMTKAPYPCWLKRLPCTTTPTRATCSLPKPRSKPSAGSGPPRQKRN